MSTDEAVDRKVRDVCVSVYNSCQKWQELVSESMATVNTLITQRILSLTPEQSMKNDPNFDINACYRRINECGSRLSEYLDEFSSLRNKLDLHVAKLRSVAGLLLNSDSKKFICKTTTDLELVQQMFEQELYCKRAVLDDLSAAADRDLLMTCAAAWTHQPYLNIQSYQMLISQLENFVDKT